jgi:hypothetical protein
MEPLVLEFSAPLQQAPDLRNTAALLADLAELRALLASSDLRALEVHARVQTSSPHFAAKEFAELALAVREFDFSQGAMHCEKLMLALNGAATSA